MAWTSGFFNSVNSDRVYNADQMSHIFEGLISDGVYEAVGNKLAVQPNNGMVIQIATGRGWFNKRWVNNDSPYLLTVAAPDVLLNRYAAVVIKVDKNANVRAVTPYLKYSQFATNPVKPTMESSENVKEYCLAYIYIGHGVTSITAANIEDTRQNKSLCGWVTGLVDQITPETLYTQFTAQFNEWFEGLVDIIDEDVETTLVNALPTNVTVTLTAAGWTQSGDVWTQDATVTNMNTTKSVIVQPNAETLAAYSNAGVMCSAQATNKLTFRATTQPTTNIKVDVVHMGV